MEQNPKQRLAQTLFFQSDKTQKEIANLVGVSEKTIYLWMKQGDWKRLRSTSRLMPSMIVENFLSQVQELNDEIRTRDQGKRYPTIQEAETFRKMIVTIGRIQKGHTQGEYMEMMQKFLTFLLPLNHELVKTISYYADDFLKSRAVEGFTPFDTGYLPTDPFEEEAEQNPLASLREARLANESGATKQSRQDTNNLAPDTYKNDDPTPVSGQCHPEFISKPYNNTEKAEKSRQSPEQKSEESEAIGTSLLVTFGEKSETTGTSLPVTFEEKSETTGNYTETSYGLSIKAFSGSATPKPEMNIETETGNNALPDDHIPGLTYRTDTGELKLIPPYQSEEYYDIPLYLRERLYDMSGQPIKDRIVSRYF